MGVLLLLFHLAWMRTAQLLFAIFEWRTVPSWDRFLDLVWTISKSLPFLALGVGLGAVLAAVAFAIGAFSIPYLLDRRNSNMFEAIATSVAAIRLNLRPMLLWALLDRVPDRARHDPGTAWSGRHPAAGRARHLARLPRHRDVRSGVVRREKRARACKCAIAKCRVEHSFDMYE